MTTDYDLVIIGGGAAGLSAGVALARFRRTVLLVDAGDPRNAPAGHVHNFLSRDGVPPAELYAIGRAEFTRYGGEFVAGQVFEVRHHNGKLVVELAGRSVTARHVLVATGARDELPDIPGLAERWGTDVLHCPYCHGFEVRDQRIGVLVTGPMGGHQALLFRQLSPRVTMLRHTGPAPSTEEREQLDALGIPIVSGKVIGVQTDDDRLTGVRLADGTLVPLDALVVASRPRARADLLAPLGLHPVELLQEGHVVATRIEADPTGATAVPGVWVAGNVTDPMAQVVTSAAAGLGVAAAISRQLVAADAQAAVAARHAHPVSTQAAWDERYAERERIWSGEPNAALVAEVADLQAGTVLEAGCGEGADALWLAGRGWRVTGVDLSQVALGRAADAARTRGQEIDWRQADLTREQVDGRYDLVAASYLHLPAAQRRAVFARLADAVAPGGRLLVLGHDFADAHVLPRPGLAESGWTADELVADLGPGWTVETAATRPRTATDVDGQEVRVGDVVMRARRDCDR